MQHTVYVTTNLSDGKFYIGKHSRIGPDSYKGSGVWVHKCKKSNQPLQCDIIAICQNEKDAYKFEYAMVKAAREQYPKLCMNFMDGGLGYPVGHNKGKPSSMLGKKHREESKAKIATWGLVNKVGEKHHMYGKKHKLESRKKMSKTHIERGHLRGKKVLCIETGIVYGSLAEAARAVSKDSHGRNNIRKSCLGKPGKFYGYTWKFI
jgi:predicted GIY-YIG superfamily endonuclease